MCYPWVKLNHPSMNRAQYSGVFPSLHDPFLSFIIALYSPINYLLPCVCTSIYPLLFYISPLLPCIIFALPYIPVPCYIHPLLASTVFVLPYIPVPFFISPLLPCIVFVLQYIPIPFYIYPLLSWSLYSHVSTFFSTYTLYSLV